MPAYTTDEASRAEWNIVEQRETQKQSGADSLFASGGGATYRGSVPISPTGGGRDFDRGLSAAARRRTFSSGDSGRSAMSSLEYLRSCVCVCVCVCVCLWTRRCECRV
jgi:hypothetical protein